MTVTASEAAPNIAADDRLATPAQEQPASPTGTINPVEADLVEADLLVEDVSIDGMCGVY